MPCSHSILARCSAKHKQGVSLASRGSVRVLKSATVFGAATKGTGQLAFFQQALSSVALFRHGCAQELNCLRLSHSLARRQYGSNRTSTIRTLVPARLEIICCGHNGWE